MIRIEFSEPHDAEWLDWRGRCDTARAALVAAHERGESPKVSNLYKDPAMLVVYRDNDGPFFGKCAYCETLVIDFQYGDIEHYRPKGAVSDHNGDVVRINNADGTRGNHPGYYWLAYDWRNLLLSCIKCNRPTRSGVTGGRIGKGTRFPVRSFQASQMGEEEREEPLLLNPVWDEPANHLDVLDNGIMKGKTDRGWMCIDIFGLNARENLVTERKRCFQRIGAFLTLLLQTDSNSEEEAKEWLAAVEDSVNGRGAYAAAARAALRGELRRGTPLGEAASVASQNG